MIDKLRFALAEAHDSLMRDGGPMIAYTGGAACYSLLPNGPAGCWDALTEEKSEGPIWQAFVEGWYEAEETFGQPR